MSIRKQHFKKKGICKVTFSVPENQCNGAQKVHVVGEFNDWSPSATPMKRAKNGAFSVAVELKQGCEYQFRYLMDNQRWGNEPEADNYRDTPYGDARNSVVMT